MGYFWGWGRVLITVLGSTYVVDQLSFSMFLSILTFDFDLILGSIFIYLFIYFRTNTSGRERITAETGMTASEGQLGAIPIVHRLQIYRTTNLH